MPLLAALCQWLRSWLSAPDGRIWASAGADLVDAARLRTLLADLADEFSFMMLTNVESQLFDRFELSQAQELTVWPTGQVFGPKSELRWRPKQDRFAVCFVTDRGSLPRSVSAMREQETLRARREKRLVRLWGKHTDNEVDEHGRPFWLEAQIPRLLRYPTGAATPPVVALRTTCYVRDDGTEAFVRFVDVEEWTHGELHESL